MQDVGQVNVFCFNALYTVNERELRQRVSNLFQCMIVALPGRSHMTGRGGGQTHRILQQRGHEQAAELLAKANDAVL